MNEKICRECKQLKSEKNFKKHSRNPSGYDTICKTCHNNQDKKRMTTVEGKVFKLKRSIRGKHKKNGTPFNESRYMMFATHHVRMFGAIKTADIPQYVYDSNLPMPEFDNLLMPEFDNLLMPEFDNLLMPEFNPVSSNEYVPSDIHQEFIPSPCDSRKKVQRSVAFRNKKFTSVLCKIHGSKCMISGCKEKTLIQGAHIHEHRSDTDDHSTNGLLLKVDLHALFDMNKLSINPHTYEIIIHQSVLDNDPEYLRYNGRTLNFNHKYPPNNNALLDRWNQFQENPCKKYKNSYLRKEKYVEIKDK